MLHQLAVLLIGVCVCIRIMLEGRLARFTSVVPHCSGQGHQLSGRGVTLLKHSLNVVAEAVQAPNVERFQDFNVLLTKRPTFNNVTKTLMQIAAQTENLSGYADTAVAEDRHGGKYVRMQLTSVRQIFICQLRKIAVNSKNALEMCELFSAIDWLAINWKRMVYHSQET